MKFLDLLSRYEWTAAGLCAAGLLVLTYWAWKPVLVGMVIGGVIAAGLYAYIYFKQEGPRK